MSPWASMNVTALGTSCRWNICPFLTDFTSHTVLRFHPCCRMRPNLLLWVYTPRSPSPSIHWRASGLFLPFAYCDQCCYEHRCANICSRPCFRFFGVCFQKWNCWVMWAVILGFIFLRKCHVVSHLFVKLTLSKFVKLQKQLMFALANNVKIYKEV